MSTRRAVIDAYRAGHSCNALAKRFKLNYNTVRTLCLRYRTQGEAGLAPRYDRCGRQAITFAPLIYRAACWLKRRHPGWGAPCIRLVLQERYPTLSLPAVRTLQRWFKKAGLTPKRAKVPQPKGKWAGKPHQIWQVDAKEHLRLGEGQRACYLTITDEHSGAFIAAPVFPLWTHQPSAAQAHSTGAHCRF